MVAKNIVEYRQQEKVTGKLKLNEINKGTKKLVNTIKNWGGNYLGFGNTKLKKVEIS